ncbi:hypothetical protein F8M41_008010 [Gigaspora margarita]|uniref:Uncharacterized protein n=1 Tax=Gigaspora margarita TaxID=4874 RepID=A0A8H3X748_GIGMA|nr:hypothetical protein F8M41_008010 [Gigaspora margarita]
MDFDNFTTIENTDLLSNFENSKGITVFIPNDYSPVLVRNNETVNSQNMIKELPGSKESSQELKNEYRQCAKDIKLEFQKRNSGKSTYKKKSTESSPYKRKKLDNHENNDLTEKVKRILNFHLNNSISKESNEINNSKEAYPKDSSERNNDQIDYSEGTKESFYQPEFDEYDIFSLNSTQIPLESYFNEWQSADHHMGNNPSVLIYGEQLTDKSENGKSTANLIDNSVLNDLQTMKNIENSESSKKALDLTELIKLIT